MIEEEQKIIDLAKLWVEGINYGIDIASEHFGPIGWEMNGRVEAAKNCLEQIQEIFPNLFEIKEEKLSDKRYDKCIIVEK